MIVIQVVATVNVIAHVVSLLMGKTTGCHMALTAWWSFSHLNIIPAFDGRTDRNDSVASRFVVLHTRDYKQNKTRKPSLEVTPTTLAQKTNKLEQQHSVERMPPPRHSEIGTVSLPPAFSGTAS